MTKRLPVAEVTINERRIPIVNRHLAQHLKASQETIHQAERRIKTAMEFEGKVRDQKRRWWVRLGTRLGLVDLP